MSFESYNFDVSPAPHEHEEVSQEVKEFNADHVDAASIESSETQPHLSPEAFIQQLSEQKRLEIENKETGEKEIIEYTEIIPENPVSEDYVVFVGGFGTNAFAYDQQLFEIARRGRKAIYINPKEGIALEDSVKEYIGQKIQNEHSKDIPELIQHKASSVLRLIEEKNLSHFDVVGHSQGGIIATLVTAVAGDKVDRLVLDTPGGLVGRKGRLSLMWGALREGINEYKRAREKMINENDPSYMKEFEEKITNNQRGDWSNPTWRFKHEIPSIGVSDIRPLLQEIQSRKDQHIPYVTLITAQNDQIFKAKDVQKQLGENPIVEEGEDGAITGYVNSWAMYSRKETGHGFLTKNDPRVMAEFIEHRREVEDAGSDDQTKVIADILLPRKEQHREAA